MIQSSWWDGPTDNMAKFTISVLTDQLHDLTEEQNIWLLLTFKSLFVNYKQLELIIDNQNDWWLTNLTDFCLILTNKNCQNRISSTYSKSFYFHLGLLNLFQWEIIKIVKYNIKYRYNILFSFFTKTYFFRKQLSQFILMTRLFSNGAIKWFAIVQNWKYDMTLLIIITTHDKLAKWRRIRIKYRRLVYLILILIVIYKWTHR